MLLEIFNIDHCLARSAATDISATVCLMQVNFVGGKLFVAVRARKECIFCGHCSNNNVYKVLFPIINAVSYYK